ARTLIPTGHEPDDDDQSVAFIAINRGNDPSVLRQIVLTKIQGWDGNDLGALVLGFSMGQTQVLGGHGAEIKSGIWLNHQFYVADLSASDRHIVAQRVQSGFTDAGGNFIVELESGPHLLFYKALRSRVATAYDVCLYPLAASLREVRALRWEIIGLGLLVLIGGFVASSFLAKKLSKP